MSSKKKYKQLADILYKKIEKKKHGYYLLDRCIVPNHPYPHSIAFRLNDIMSNIISEKCGLNPIEGRIVYDLIKYKLRNEKQLNK
jgi:hypothetical protein